MIREVELYHGVAILRLVRGAPEPIGVSHLGRSKYLLDDGTGLYVKYSTKRLTPWSFSFSAEQQRDIASLREECGRIFVVLVCGQDGVACLSDAELSRVLDEDHKDEWVKAARKRNEKYSITGSDERRVFKVGDNEYPLKIFTPE